jgi:hypothetical protein
MRPNNSKPLEERIATRVARSKAGVFLPRDFSDLAGYTQVLRALRKQTKQGRLVKLGYGVYGKARVNSITGQPMLAAEGGFQGAAREALQKLGVAWEPTEAERAYNSGQSTQIPLMPVVKVKDRFARKLGYRNLQLVCER